MMHMISPPRNFPRDSDSCKVGTLGFELDYVHLSPFYNSCFRGTPMWIVDSKDEGKGEKKIAKIIQVVYIREETDPP